MCVWTGDIICHLDKMWTFNTDSCQHFECFSRCLCRLTLDSCRPGAVVENSQLSKHLPWPHGAELQALLCHLHLPVWNKHRNTGKPLVVMLFRFHCYFSASLASCVSPRLCSLFAANKSFSCEMEWMIGVWGLLVHFGSHPAGVLWTQWLRKTIRLLCSVEPLGLLAA